MYAVQTLLNKIQNSKSIDFGDLFNETLDVFKKVWVQGLLLQLFSLIIMLPFIIVFYVPYISLMIESSTNQSMDYTEFNETLFEGFGLYMVLAYLAIFVLSIASSLLYLGFYKIVKDMDRGNPFVVSDFFYFSNSKL